MRRDFFFLLFSCFISPTKVRETTDASAVVLFLCAEARGEYCYCRPKKNNVRNLRGGRPGAVEVGKK